MPWVKIDDNFASHPKIVAAGPMAGWLYICGLTYSARYLTDGFIPAKQVRLLADIESPATVAAKLVECGLWEPVDGGYMIHDYLKYNPSGVQVKRDREAAAARQAAWRERNAQPTEDEADNAKENNGEVMPLVPEKFTPPVPVPVPVPVPNPVKTMAAKKPAARKGRTLRPISAMYKDKTKAWPNAQQEEAIESTVKDVPLFAKTIDFWLMSGWSPKNVQGMLDMYKAGGPKSNGKGKRNDRPVEPDLRDSQRYIDDAEAYVAKHGGSITVL